MLATLLESRRRSPKRRAALVASAIAHSALLSVLVMTRARGDETVTEEPVPPLVYIAPEPNATVETGRHSPSSEPAVGPPSLLPAGDDLPRIDVRVGEVAGPLPGGRIVIHFNSAERVALTPSDALPALAVDHQVEAIPGQRPPRYPISLERAGIEGGVTARFIVDTLGRVEPGSIDVRDATHAEFARVVRERLLDLRFVPAQSRGRVVRQLVEQRFHFEVVRR